METADYLRGSIEIEQYMADLEQVRLHTEDEGVVILSRVVEKLVRDFEALLMDEGL